VTSTSRPSADFELFLKSMQYGYMEWHEGIGYDLESLARLASDERVAAEDILLARRNQDWRDVEALDCLGSPRALASIREALKSKDFEVRIAATQKLAARCLLDEQEIESIVLKTLPAATLQNGLTSTLRLAGSHPTLAVRRELLRCALDGNDDVRVHAAALVHFIYGVSSEPFDWKFRPFYLRFGSKKKRERRQAYLELCAAIGVDPSSAS
jgi:hypothetical protein